LKEGGDGAREGGAVEKLCKFFANKNSLPEKVSVYDMFLMFVIV
jgi:hypothetical protein